LNPPTEEDARLLGKAGLNVRLLARISKELRGWGDQLKELGFRVMLLWVTADVVRLTTGAPMRGVSQVTPRLHLGGQYQRRGWSRLAARGITAVVNLRAEFDDNHAGIAPTGYLHLPTVEDKAPTLEQLHKGSAFIRAEIARGGGVYVHCRSGVGRAATMAAAYLVSTGLTPGQAWARVRQVRPFIWPTPAQSAQVERFTMEEK
jgi:protein tyrosine phosphatase (PTP) superfamily phosphohydrolase (DUF442 family)